MTPTTEAFWGVVSPVERARRITEMRQLSLQAKHPPQVVYHGAHQFCPWGCGLRIDGINFQLENWVSKEEHARWLASWWTGPGLVGRCPRCNQLVLYSVLEKRKAAPETNAPIMPGDWFQRGHVLPRPAEGSPVA